jgi:hypothetical protein
MHLDLIGKSGGNILLQRLRCRCETVLKSVLKNKVLRVWMKINWLRTGLVVGSCEHFDSTKGEKFIEVCHLCSIVNKVRNVCIQ